MICWLLTAVRVWTVTFCWAIKWLNIDRALHAVPREVESWSTFHQSSIRPAVVVEVYAMDVSQAVVSQLWGVTQTLQDWVHETLENHKQQKSQQCTSRLQMVLTALSIRPQSEVETLTVLPRFLSPTRPWGLLFYSNRKGGGFSWLVH